MVFTSEKNLLSIPRSSETVTNATKMATERNRLNTLSRAAGSDMLVALYGGDEWRKGWW